MMAINKLQASIGGKEQEPEEFLNMMNQEEAEVNTLVQELDMMALDSDPGDMTMYQGDEIQEHLREEDIQAMMYENDTIWNMERVTQWDDEYVIHSREEEVIE